MEEELLKIKNNASSLIFEVESLDEINKIKMDFLGKSGVLTIAFKRITKIPEEKRPEIGRLANEIKDTIEQLFEQKTQEINERQKEKRGQKVIDVTLPGATAPLGHLHPLTQVTLELVDIFKQLGYQAANGPEIETDYYNFEALNIPKEHPARDTQQTLYLDSRGTDLDPWEIIMRTQTSAMQGRVMERTKPPFRVIVPGKNFRYEQVDASHGFEFWQLEGFFVDKNVRLTDLFGTIDYVLKKIMGEKTEIKFATTNFPFVEPGVDTYMRCTVCAGRGCAFCKYAGWSEIMPAGMIHPNVLSKAEIDPKEYNGFAFAIGLSRIATLKYQMDDLRLLTNTDFRILKQF